jgi:hypothetical protein
MAAAAARHEDLATWWHRATLLGDADGQAPLGAAHHLGAATARDLVAALASLTRAHIAQSQFADHFCWAARDGCTADACAEAERRMRIPLGGRAEGS